MRRATWRKHFGSLEPSDVTRLRQLKQENGRLKKMVADRDLEIDVLKEITQERVGATCAAGNRSRLPDHAVCQPPRGRRALRRAIVVGRPVSAGGAGCPRPGRDAPLGGQYPALDGRRFVSFSLALSVGYIVGVKTLTFA